MDPHHRTLLGGLAPLVSGRWFSPGCLSCARGGDATPASRPPASQVALCHGNATQWPRAAPGYIRGQFWRVIGFPGSVLVPRRFGGPPLVARRTSRHVVSTGFCRPGKEGLCPPAAGPVGKSQRPMKLLVGRCRRNRCRSSLAVLGRSELGSRECRGGSGDGFEESSLLLRTPITATLETRPRNLAPPSHC